MSRRIWAIALAVVMVASALVALPAAFHPGPAAAPAATASSGLKSEVGSIGIALYNGYGDYSTEFTPGPSAYGTIFFEVLDTTGDTSVNITIFDSNASRDGVSTPAYQIQVPINQTTHLFQSWVSGVHYDIPSSVVYAAEWNLTASATLGGTNAFDFYVYTYYLTGSSAPSLGSVVLPGESLNLFWQTGAAQYFDSDSLSPYTYVTNLTMTASYVAFDGVDNVTTPFFGPNFWTSLPVAAIGQTTVTIPDNATPGYYVYLYLYASVYQNGQIIENESNEYYFLVGYPVVDYARASASPSTDCGSVDYYFEVDQPIFACAVAGAGFGGDFSPIAGLTVKIAYHNESGPVTVSGAPTSLTTDQNGMVSLSISATIPPFTTYLIGYPYSNSINYTVAYPTATAWAETHFSEWAVDEFWVEGSSTTANVAVTLSQTTYLPGQTITANWQLGSSSSSSTGPLTPIYWMLENQNRQEIGQGTISSTATSGTETVSLPSGYSGLFYYGVFAENATEVFSGWASATVTTPTVNVNPSTETYLPGTSVSVMVSSDGTGGATGLTLQYEVVAYYYSNTAGFQSSGVTQSGTIANGSSFSIAVPSTNVPAYYEIDAWLTSASGQTLAWNDNEIDELTGFGLTLTIQTNSVYTDGSYQPGETLTVGYTISAYGLATVPTVYGYEVALEDTSDYVYHEGSGTSGTFQVTIPSGQPSGALEIYMEVYGSGLGLNGPNCYDDYCDAYTLVIVNAHPSVLNEELGANSGLTVGWLILLILILVVAVILVLMIRRRRPPTPSSPPNSSNSMPPPAPAPSGSAPTEWKEPNAQGSGDQPPMPTPPPGAG